MRKNVLIMSAVVALSSSIMFSSCIGSFSLSNKILAWNKTVDNKFVNELVFVALNIVPVYPLSMVADLLVINSIEFWTGDNPIEAGIVKEVKGENGIYTVETLENGYQIQNEAGEAVELIYNKEDNTWSVVQNEESTKLIKIVDENEAIVYMPNGSEQTVELSNAGMMAFRQIANSTYLATR
ncbi:DUF3332 domain-containing protein [Dysgonomonas sp. 216]|uniref:DUF3332 domain-containing protein n=1 Tax=Dysgonomonas sp. 216 TaxID=2302934 RepID=UPI0013D0FE57|nr:DUF3332 domain-containing protein [Dysgonomonas sp. 216]NDW19155.1 DUF3332 domain-containing protein [Dysgonomonas sp. 216]